MSLGVFTKSNRNYCVTTCFRKRSNNTHLLHDLHNMLLFLLIKQRIIKILKSQGKPAEQEHTGTRKNQLPQLESVLLT